MFTSPLVIEALPAPNQWKLVAPLVWCDAIFGRIIVPPGFETDLASVPDIVRALPDFNPTGLSRRPAVVHDWLYTNKPVTREMADRFLYAALVYEGVPVVAANIFYDAVRTFGFSHWSS